MKILITSGATREPLDGVRYLTNFSTGGTGARLADGLLREGHEVTYVAGESALRPTLPCEIARFQDFRSLDALLQRLLGGEPFDAVIQAAAVSDYSISSVVGEGKELFADGQPGKLDSSSDELTVKLRRNFKIVERLKAYSRPREPRVVAFKLTNTADAALRAEAVSRLTRNPAIDFVVHNDLSEITRERHCFTLFDGSGKLAQCQGAEELALLLSGFLRSER